MTYPNSEIHVEVSETGSEKFVPEGVSVPRADLRAVNEVSVLEAGEDGSPSGFFSIFKRWRRKEGFEVDGVMVDWSVADAYGVNQTLEGVVLKDGVIDGESVITVHEAHYVRKGLVAAGAVLAAVGVVAGTIRMTNRSSTGS